MKRLLLVGVAALAVALGFMAMSATGDSVSAQSVETGRVSIECTQTQDPSEDNGWVGEVTCTLTVDMPDPQPDITLSLLVQYEDVDQSGTPTFGDRLICWEAQLPDGGTVGTCE